MNPFLHIAIVNAITVIPLAVLAFVVLRRGCRAPVHHTVWVLVLLKFVTPPLFNLPVELAVLPAPAAEHHSASVSPRPAATNSPLVATIPAAPQQRVTSTPSSTTPAVSDTLSMIPMNLSWPSLLLWVWCAGTACWLIVQIGRAVRFETLITYRSRCPDELQSECAELAQRLGIVHVPRVCVIDAPLSPMLWGFGQRAKLLFPAKLAERMPAEARATLLMHELAHYRRGDHRVRLLELLVTGLFWWHPVVWWARRQIEEAEEECCDAWVVQQFPQSPRCYAEALLDTIDFLCEHRRALPPLASGLGQAPFLRRRLMQIMQGATLPPIDRSTRWTLVAAAVCLLPLQPFVLSAAIPQRLPTPKAAEVSLTTKSDGESVMGNAVQPAASTKRTPGLTPRTKINEPTLPRVTNRPPRTRKNGEIWSTAVSPDGRYVIRITTRQKITLTDIVNNVDTDLSAYGFTAVAFTPDGASFVSTGRDEGRVMYWNATTGTVRRNLLNDGNQYSTIAVSPEGERVAVGARNGQVVVLDLTTSEVLLSLTAPSAVNSVRFSPNGRQIAVACGDWMKTAVGQVLVYDASEPRMLHRLASVSSGAISFASDEELIVGGWNGRIQLWNLASRSVVAEAQIDKNLVAAASFSADNPALREAELLPVTPAADQEDTFSFLRGLLDP